jgi:glycosyltransferase involved in cell wall biosynthesis
MKLACLTRYDELGASSRVRFGQFQAAFERLAPGIEWSRQSLLDARYLRRKYAARATLCDILRCFARRAIEVAHQPVPDLRWVEKELWPFAPAWLERTVLARRPYVLDLDDAVFHTYDRHPRTLVRWAWGRKIDRLMRGAALVTAGNAYLAQRAHDAGAHRVEVVPTVVDLDHYPRQALRSPIEGGSIDIVWIGSPSTVAYLQALAEPLQRLSTERPIRLVVIGADAPRFGGVEVLARPWSPGSEAAELSRCHIGVMPLPDSPWERGKCGYKLIQYMACGLPVVASPVGANCEIVDEDHNGLFANDGAQWTTALRRLVNDAALRQRLGNAGREVVERHYSVQALASRLVALLQDAALRS